MIWQYIFMAYFSLFALGLSDNIRGPLYPEVLKAFHVSDTRGAAFFGVSSLLGFCGSFLVRFLLLKLTRIHTLQLAMAMMGLSLLGMAWSPEFSWMLFFSATFGFSLGLVGVVQNVLVTLGTPPPRRQQLMAGLHATYGVASLAAPLTVAGATALAFSWSHSAEHSWRAAFVVAAVLALAVLASSFWANEKTIVATADIQENVAPKKNAARGSHLGQIYIALAMSLYVLVEILVESRLALYVRRAFNFDFTESTYYVTAFFVCLLAGRLIFTFCRIHFSVRKILSWSLVTATVLLALGLKVHPVFLVLSGLGMAPFYPLAMAYISHHYQDALDSAISTTLAMTYLMTVVMHELVGYLTDLYGIGKALWVGPIALILAFVVLNTFERIFKRTPADHVAASKVAQI
jgi:fucose permease